MPALAKSSPQVTHTLAEELSQFALQLSYHAIPATVRERAKHLILDSVGIALASTKYPFASISLSALEELGTGNSPVIGIGRRLALRDAVLMNGILIHGLDFDDTHSRGVIHATASSFPCALALTDRAEADGRTLLSAYVAAMEVATQTRIGRQRRFSSSRLSSDRIDWRLRLHARGGQKLLGLDPASRDDGARHCAFNGERQPGVSRGRRLDQAHASGMGWGRGHHGGDTGEARVRRTESRLRRPLRPLCQPSR